MLRPAVFALLVFTSLAACNRPPDDPAATAIVGEADVERLRAETFIETLDVDAAIARVEAEQETAASAGDSTLAEAYAPVVERLRQERLRLQTRLDTLRPLPRARFDSVRADVSRHLARLRAATDRAPFEAAPTAAALRAAAARALAGFDTRLDGRRPDARADTTGRLTRDLDSLAADRRRLDDRLMGFADTSATAFEALRVATLRDALRLRTRLDALAPDTTGRDS